MIYFKNDSDFSQKGKIPKEKKEVSKTIRSSLRILKKILKTISETISATTLISETIFKKNLNEMILKRIQCTVKNPKIRIIAEIFKLFQIMYSLHQIQRDDLIKRLSKIAKLLESTLVVYLKLISFSSTSYFHHPG